MRVRAVIRPKLLATLLCSALALAACGRRSPDATPEGAAQKLVELMRHVHGDPGDAKAAYKLMSQKPRTS